MNEVKNIKLSFDLQVPSNNGSFSFDERAMWLSNWLPVQAVFDNNGWNKDPYYPYGDIFYSETANYELNVEVPKGYWVVTSGNDEHMAKNHGSSESFQVRATNVRDFAMSILSNKYKNIRSQVNGINVYTWFTNVDNEELAVANHQTAVAAISFYSNLYGGYPYQQFDVVRIGDFSNGFAFPGLIQSPGYMFQKDSPSGFGDIPGKVAYQWWGSIIGSNKVKEPWVQAILNDYATKRFMEIYQPGSVQEVKTSDVLAIIQPWEEKEIYLNSPIEKFKDFNSYYDLLYFKGPQMLSELEKAIGQEKMDPILKDYCEKYQYVNGSGEELIDVFAEVLGPGVREYFNKWLNEGMTTFEIKKE